MCADDVLDLFSLVIDQDVFLAFFGAEITAVAIEFFGTVKSYAQIQQRHL